MVKAVLRTASAVKNRKYVLKRSRFDMRILNMKCYICNLYFIVVFKQVRNVSRLLFVSILLLFPLFYVNFKINNLLNVI